MIIFTKELFSVHTNSKGQEGGLSSSLCYFNEMQMTILTYAPINSEGVAFDETFRAISQERWNISGM